MEWLTGLSPSFVKQCLPGFLICLQNFFQVDILRLNKEKKQSPIKRIKIISRKLTRTESEGYGKKDMKIFFSK